METQILVRNMKLNDRSEDYIQKKMVRLERHLREDAEAKLELSQTAARSQTDRFTAQMTIKVSGATLRGQESGLSLFAAVDAVADVMDKQIRRYKGKAYRTFQARKSARGQAMRQNASAMQDDVSDAHDPYDPDNTAADTPDDLGKIVRVKRFAMKPMSIEDAIMEMELLDHDFFLFRNAESSEYNVVYRRTDGDYGVIEPDVA